MDHKPVLIEGFVQPAHYAIRKALSDMFAPYQMRGTAEHWLWPNEGSPNIGHFDMAETIEKIEHGPLIANQLSSRRTDSRVRGKPCVSFQRTYLIPDTFRSFNQDEGWGGTVDVVVARKEEIHLRKGYMEERSAVSGLTVCKHALERFYEREGCCQRTIKDRILHDLAQVDRYLAFATAGNVFALGNSYDPNAITLVPLGEGMLVIRNAIIAVHGLSPPATRFVRKKRNLFSTMTVADPLRSFDVDDIDGNKVNGFLMAMGATYLSEDILFLEQRAYLDLFKAEAAKFDLEDLSSNMGRTWMAHEKVPEPSKIEVNWRLPYLLSQISGTVRHWPLWYSIGWNKHNDPVAGSGGS